MNNMTNMKYKPYAKVLAIDGFYGACAIYEPHPFRKSAIKEVVKQAGYKMSDCKVIGSPLVPDDEWCWVYYDWCGNPIGMTEDMPEGKVVDKFTEENLGRQSLADYLNTEPAFMTT